jgi:cytochrome c556
MIAFGLAMAQSPGAQAARARKANFNTLLGAYKVVGDELKRSDPDLAAIRPAAARMDQMARQLPSWFPPGSGEESGADTKAKPLIWTDPSGFRRKASDLQSAVSQLDAAAQKGDLQRLRAAQRTVSTACNACHEVYEERFW